MIARFAFCILCMLLDVVLGLHIITVAWSADLPEYPCVFDGTVSKVSDGDTFQITITEWPAGCGAIQIRVQGIDTPESSKQFASKKCPVREVRRGLEAKTRAKSLLPIGSRVTVRGMGKADTYGRRLGHVETENGGDVATVLLSEGLARRYDPLVDKSFTKPNWCK
jgi:endonuclease YncB( thermonuclease family)